MAPPSPRVSAVPGAPASSGAPKLPRYRRARVDSSAVAYPPWRAPRPRCGADTGPSDGDRRGRRSKPPGGGDTCSFVVTLLVVIAAASSAVADRVRGRESTGPVELTGCLPPVLTPRRSDRTAAIEIATREVSRILGAHHPISRDTRWHTPGCI